METSVRHIHLDIGGMTCVNCQNKIEKKLRSTAGIVNVRVSYKSGCADIAYDADIISLRDIRRVIEALGYLVPAGVERPRTNTKKVAGYMVIIAGLYALLSQLGVLNLLVPSRLADSNMGYGMLFVIGLVTSVHCIAMCGGINLSQCIPRGEAAPNDGKAAAFYPALLYNLGRVISYTTVGFILGEVGLLFGGGAGVGLPVFAQGILKLIAGFFMVIMGMNMLALFPWLRRLQPQIPKFLSSKIGAGKARSKSPLIVGLLNGLMPCGPLQSMQIVALASGNPFAGALSMFLFSLGTVPLMLGLGSIVAALGQRFAKKIMAVGAVFVVVLGLAMLSQGGSLSGLLPPDLLLPIVIGLCAVGIASSLPFKKPSHKAVSTITASALAVLMLAAWNGSAFAGSSEGDAADSGGVRLVDGKQVVTSTLSSGKYPNITVQVGTPVKWVITAPEGSVNGCNYQVSIPKYGLRYEFKTGENILEFTPTDTGKYTYSCWMGMIRGTITVTQASISEAADKPEQSVGSGGSDESQEAFATIQNGVQYVTSSAALNGYEPIRVREGLPVKWTLNMSEEALTACNNAIYIPEYDMEIALHAGGNLIEFTPEKSGRYLFSCWMGMIYGSITVERADGTVDNTQDDGAGNLPSCCG